MLTKRGAVVVTGAMATLLSLLLAPRAADLALSHFYLQKMESADGPARKAAMAQLLASRAYAVIPELFALMIRSEERGDHKRSSDCYALLHDLVRHGEQHMAPFIIECLQHPDMRVRHRAALECATSRNVARHAIPALIQCLQDPYAAIRVTSAQALGTTGREASVAIIALKAGEGDEYLGVRQMCGWALAQIDKDTGE